jgi:hypothetical protein
MLLSSAWRLQAIARKHSTFPNDTNTDLLGEELKRGFPALAASLEEQENGIHRMRIIL